jgi:hypothetical protein
MCIGKQIVLFLIICGLLARTCLHPSIPFIIIIIIIIIIVFITCL